MLTALLSTVSICAFASADDADSVMTLGGIEVVKARDPMGVTTSKGGTLSISAARLLKGMRTLGEADAINTLSMLPGYTTVSDYSSGLSVRGAQYGHTSYAIDGARVFFPYHFGGTFSMFNTSHFRRFAVSAGSRPVGSPMFAGAHIDALTSSTPADSLGLTANVGLLASSLSVEMPVGGRTSLSLSGRISYIDMLYAPLLKDDDNTTSYGLCDANLTLIHALTDRDVLKVNAFTNYDRVRYDDGSYGMDLRMHWRNIVASALWSHSGDAWSMMHKASYSAAASMLDIGIPQTSVSIPSSVWQADLSGRYTHHDRDLDIAWRIEHNAFSPQSSTVSGSINTSSEAHRMTSDLAAVDLSKAWQLSAVRLSAAGRLWLYHSSKTRGGIDPKLSLEYGRGPSLWMVSASMATQTMQMVGLGDIGLASDFWIPAGAAIRPLRATGVDAEYRYSPPQRGIVLSAALYYKHIANEAEYQGNILDVISETYDPLAHISTSNGFNTGGELSLTLSRGPLDAMIGYALAVCRRHFAEEPHRWLPSATEPLHSFKACVDVAVTDRLSVSSYFTLASGRRYTPVNAIYIIGGNVLTEYGRRNSANLPLYHRLDLSATYTLKPLAVGKCRLQPFINLSIQNIYAHRNIEMLQLSINPDKGTVAMRRLSSLYRLLPSLSFTVKI